MKHNAKKTLALLLALVMVLSLVPAMGTAAYADDTSYTLTIPSTLTVADKGWNATDGISATGTLESGKKLTVTASSANSWALKSGDNTVGYTLTTAEGGSQTTSWEFTMLDGAAQGLGIIVEDYSTKPAGTYQDTVTFTASVENAAGPLAAAFEDGAKFKVGGRWNGRYDTYLEFTNSGGTYSLTSVSGTTPEDFNSSTLTVKNGNVLALDFACVYAEEGERDDDFSARIEFDATYSTYNYSSKGSLFNGIISVSVNDTDITNQLSEKTN